MRVSVVINTLDRAEALRAALHALEFSEYAEFEVVVVNGPSTDDTERVLAEYGDRIKTASCPEANLSASRNLGIRLAAGDVVAFLDDDAYPDPAWLEHLVAGYTDPEVAAVGGPVLDHTGVQLQVRYLRSNRFGGAVRVTEEGINPSYVFSVPGAAHFPSVLGANSSFRRDRLVEIGGFDEEYEYFLDETDVCVRLVDLGHVVLMLDDGFVYHKFLPSRIRTDDRVARSRYSVVKNATYFAMRHALPNFGFAATCAGIAQLVEDHRLEMRQHAEAGTLSWEEYERFESDVIAASDRGLEDSLQPARTKPAHWFADPPPFLPYRRRLPAGRRLHIALVTREYLPGPVNGIGRLFAAEAIGLARRGHHVHVVTEGTDHATEDFEDGVWVRRVVPSASDDGAELDVPARIGHWAFAVRDAAREIAARRELDAVVAPIWDSEGLALLDEPRTAPVVVGVYTPLSTVAEMDPTIAAIEATELGQLLRAERACVERADLVLASGPWTIEEVERGHRIQVPRDRRAYALHGLPDLTEGVEPEKPPGGPHLLFVGRLEPRKGIDVLVDCLPAVMADFPELVVSLAGQDVAGIASSLLDRFEPDAAARVRVLGRVDDDRLRSLYAGCDVFVAPSRYESFGLVAVEAMMFAKPVIASRVGGLQAIVEDEVTGLLVEAGDAGALATALRRILEDEAIRSAMGAAGRSRFEAEFDERRMVERLEAVLESVSRPTRV